MSTVKINYEEALEKYPEQVREVLNKQKKSKSKHKNVSPEELNEIKLKLDSTEYDFLCTNKHLGNNIMLLTLGGSHAYGTAISTPEYCSDLDIRGIFAPRIEELLGLSRYEEFENKITDTVIHSLDKVINLMINANPNVIEMFGTKPEHIFKLSEEGKMLKDNFNLFLSRKATHSFGGYAQQQLRRGPSQGAGRTALPRGNRRR